MFTFLFLRSDFKICVSCFILLFPPLQVHWLTGLSSSCQQTINRTGCRPRAGRFSRTASFPLASRWIHRRKQGLPSLSRVQVTLFTRPSDSSHTSEWQFSRIRVTVLTHSGVGLHAPERRKQSGRSPLGKRSFWIFTCDSCQVWQITCLSTCDSAIIRQVTWQKSSLPWTMLTVPGMSIVLTLMFSWRAKINQRWSL